MNECDWFKSLLVQSDWCINETLQNNKKENMMAKLILRVCLLSFSYQPRKVHVNISRDV